MCTVSLKAHIFQGIWTLYLASELVGKIDRQSQSFPKEVNDCLSISSRFDRIGEYNPISPTLPTPLGFLSGDRRVNGVDSPGTGCTVGAIDEGYHHLNRIIPKDYLPMTLPATHRHPMVALHRSLDWFGFHSLTPFPNDD